MWFLSALNDFVHLQLNIKRVPEYLLYKYTITTTRKELMILTFLWETSVIEVADVEIDICMCIQTFMCL